MADPSTPPPLPAAHPASFASRTSPAAIWSLVLAILSFFCGWLFTAIPAVICGHVARANIRNSNGALSGKGIATAGLIVGYLGLALGLLGIPLLIGMIKSDLDRTHRLAIERKDLASTDGSIHVKVPGDWAQLPELNAKAVVRAGNKSKEQYLIVISESKTEVGNMTLEKHHRITRDQMLQTMKGASATEPVTLSINGYPALQDELSGTKQDMKVVFVHTTVDGGDHYHQILAWSLKSRWNQNKDLLREVTKSLQIEK